MRQSLGIGLVVFAVIVLPALAQSQSSPVVSSRTVLSNLQLEVNTAPYRHEMKFGELLDLMSKELEKNDRKVTFTVSDEDVEGAPEISDLPIRLSRLPAKTTIGYVLREAMKQFKGAKMAFVVRAGRVDIVPIDQASKAYLLNQTFHADFKDQRLDLALEELSDLTGVTIVLDGRAKQKTETAVTARFRDDVALQDAVRMLADMADLKLVYLVTGLYVTTPEHAKAMEKELRLIYDPSPFGGMAYPMGVGTPLPLDPNSPVAPPLPPRAPDVVPPDVNVSPLPLAPPLPPARLRPMDKAGA